MWKRKTSRQEHHIIPVCMCWETKDDNLILLKAQTHTFLHKTQNIPWTLIRKFKEKLNEVIIPNDSFLTFKEKLLNIYFWDPQVIRAEQLESLNIQWNNRADNFEEAIYNLINYEKIKIKRMIIQRYEHLDLD